MRILVSLVFLLFSVWCLSCEMCSSIFTQGRRSSWQSTPNITQTNGTFTTKTGRISVRFMKYGDGQATGVKISGITMFGDYYSQVFEHGVFKIPPGTYTVYVQGHIYGVGTLEGHICYD